MLFNPATPPLLRLLQPINVYWPPLWTDSQSNVYGPILAWCSLSHDNLEVTLQPLGCVRAVLFDRERADADEPYRVRHATAHSS